MKKLIFLFSISLMIFSCKPAEETKTLWDLALEKKDVLKVSTIFTAHDVRDRLSTESGLDSAIQWCKDAGITRVFIESFRGYTAERGALLKAKNRFIAAGIEASGCITPVNFGKTSTGMSIVSCYSDTSTQNRIREIMEYTASMFDLIMIDDFLFTDCNCEQCLAAKGGRTLSQYRCDLLTDVGQKYILEPARKVNPEVKVIIKFPQWYDDFHRRGYEVLGQTAIYDTIWVGTETRDSDLSRYDRGWEMPQYEGYFIMRWLGDIGKSKTGGGWFDALGTTPVNYLEQARQTVLGGAKEFMLFSYGGLIREKNNYGNREGTGIANVDSLKKELPGLFELAGMIKGKAIKGILAPKPANSDPYHQSIDEEKFYNYQGDAFVYDYIGMMGLPLVPAERIDAEAEAAFFSVHALKDPGFKEKLSAMLSGGKPVMITDFLASKLETIPANNDNLIVLKLDGNIRNLLKYDRTELNAMRDKMLAPWKIKFDAPAQVSLYLFGDDILIIENFNNAAVDAKVGMSFSKNARLKLTLPSAAKVMHQFTGDALIIQNLPPRTLAVFTY
ncbi:MAG TPA: hypothetical protein VI583_12420 [Cyclobacteriaceae bacterium]|nr:hypothetical protein [Cyclobacteriaceae bacterium]